MAGVLLTEIVVGQTYVIGGAVVRFVSSTTKRTRLAMAAPGREVEFRAADEEEKALTFPEEGG